MSMPSFLSRFGIDTVRYVTTSGEVVFDGVTPAAGGYTHASHGLVTPVAHHTFHGGEDEPDDAPTEIVWWLEGDEVDRHVSSMQTAFPEFLYVPGTEDLAPCWAGEINTGRGRFNIGVVLRRDCDLPIVKLINGPKLGIHSGRRWVPSPHLYLNGNLCVADRTDWDAESHTAATATAWAAHWLAAYTEWRITRRWPIQGAHPVAA